MEIFVKSSPHKIDPKHPESTDPTWQRAFKLAQRRKKEGRISEQFSDGYEKEWYYNRVKSNPQNIEGLPPFFPPLHIREFYPEIVNSEYDEWKRFLDKINDMQVSKCHIFCENCMGVKESSPKSRVTLHFISKTDCYCSVCGKHKQYRTL
jgi:hypothetical protein